MRRSHRQRSTLLSGPERVKPKALASPRLHAATGDAVDLEIDGLRRAYRVAYDGSTYRVNSPEGQATLPETPRFPSAEDDQPAVDIVTLQGERERGEHAQTRL